jgi:hypothetical protein
MKINNYYKFRFLWKRGSDYLENNLAQDIVKYGHIISDKELFDSGGKPVRIRLVYYQNAVYYHCMVAGQLEELIDISEV